MGTIASPSKGVPAENESPLTLDDAVRRVIALDDEDARRAWIVRCLQRLPMDELLPHLKDVVTRYLNRDPSIAMHLAEALIFAANVSERADYRALGLMARGDVFGVLGRHEDVIVTMDEAAAVYRALGDEIGWARSRKEWLRSSHRMGRGEAAIPSADRARAVLEKHHLWYRAATIEYCIAVACADLGRHTEALARYDHALTMYDLVGDAELETAQLKQNQALLLMQLGDLRGALRLYEEIGPIFRRYDQTVDILRQAHNIALVHAAQGHYTVALHAYNAALTGYQRAGLNYEIVCAAINTIECYLHLNRDGDALELAEDAIEHADRFAMRVEAAQARFYCALAYARLGDRERALSVLEAVERESTAAGLGTMLALVTFQRAILHGQDAEWARAAQEAERASEKFRLMGQTIRTAQADLARAQAACALGDRETATRLAQSALATSRAREVPWLAPEAHHVLGDIARAGGDLPAALGAYDAAITGIERIQSALATELRTHFLADKVRVYDDAIAVCLGLGEHERAFGYLERAKSRALVDYLAGNLEVGIRASEDADPALVATLARLREEHNWFYNRLYGYGYGFAAPAGGGPTLSDEALRQAVRERERQIARLLERLALDRTAGLALGAAPEAAVPSVPALAPGTVLLEYYLTTETGAVFILSEGGITVVPLAVRPAAIVQLLNQWQLNLAATARALGSGLPLDGLGRNARGILGALYRALVAPVAAQIAGYARMIVVPHGPTHAVPFHALYDGTRYLLEAMEVTVCPSSGLLRICTERPRRPGRSALVVAYSDGDRLPAVRAEAAAIAALLPGECHIEAGATRDALTAGVSRHSVVHLAAHGEARLDNPTFAHLKLADGQLSMVDIFNLPLQGALVTLSACETGRSVVAGGDELIGLSRGFLYAGAATLVQSLWRVEDGSTARLMEQFYRGIGAGHPKGAALRDAQRAMLATNGAHPYFWAPFQLIGDDGPL